MPERDFAESAKDTRKLSCRYASDFIKKRSNVIVEGDLSVRKPLEAARAKQNVYCIFDHKEHDSSFAGRSG